MKLAVTGKGGAGKTTISALLINTLAGEKREVLAVDCDPDSNLGTALGFKGADKITPIIKMESLIRERMGVSDDGAFFKLNPKIDDIPNKFSKDKNNIKLIVMGTIKKSGSGCVCPENAFVKNLIEHLVLKRNEDVVMDMEAGIEHFGRGTAEACDSALIIVEPTCKSIDSAIRINALAHDLKIKKVFAIANKIKDNADDDFIKHNMTENKIELIASIPLSEDILKIDKTGDLSGLKGEVLNRIKKIESFLQERIGR